MIYVCDYWSVEQTVQDTRATHLLSILEPGAYIKRPQEIVPAHHLTVGLDDIEKPRAGMTVPSTSHIEAILDFIDAWRGEGRLVIHCQAGVSRSPAAALIVLTHLNPGQEEEAAKIVRRSIPHARPNQKMIAISDDILDRGGRLVRAVRSVFADLPSTWDTWDESVQPLPILLTPDDE